MLSCTRTCQDESITNTKTLQAPAAAQRTLCPALRRLMAHPAHRHTGTHARCCALRQRHRDMAHTLTTSHVAPATRPHKKRTTAVLLTVMRGGLQRQSEASHTRSVAVLVHATGRRRRSLVRDLTAEAHNTAHTHECELKVLHTQIRRSSMPDVVTDVTNPLPAHRAGAGRNR